MMRTKNQILYDIHKDIIKAPPESRLILSKVYLIAEIFLDIRDELYTIKNTLIDLGLQFEKRL